MLKLTTTDMFGSFALLLGFASGWAFSLNMYFASIVCFLFAILFLCVTLIAHSREKDHEG